MKDNKDKVKDIIKSIIGEEAFVIGVPVELIHYFNSPQKAVALAQIIYLSDKGKKTGGWVFKTYDEMFEVTGVKESTLRNYYVQYKKLGFFETRVVKANGFPTVHFKFHLDKFTKSFTQFLQKRYSKNQSIETSETEESLTKNTNKDNSLYIKPYTKAKSQNVNENKADDSGLSSKVNGSNDLNDLESLFAALPIEEQFPLTGTFEPSLENLFWAVLNFPRKSPKLCTEGFINYFTIKTAGKKNTLEGWQAEWRKWAERQYEINGYDEKKLRNEQKKIRNKVLLIVHRYAANVNRFLLHRESFYSILCKEENSFSRDTIDDCLERLEMEGVLTRYFGNYFYVCKVIEDGKLNDVTDFSLVFDEGNKIDPNILQCIIDNKLTHRSEIGKDYPEKFQSSIDIYLKGSIQSGALIENQNYYFYSDMYQTDEDYKNAVNANFEKLGIKNSLVQESFEDNLEDELNELRFAESQELPDYFSDYHADLKARLSNYREQSQV